ncbi:MAG: HAMP domain-containing histidine kinase [Bacteroidales bacterium]|nr:HAMP domain-containing histidine kinase [Bacteroidales bacterium]
MKKSVKRFLIILPLLAVAAALCFARLTPEKALVRDARVVERMVGRKLRRLDAYAGRAFLQDPSQWMHLEDLPQDMAVYRYVGGTLQSWCHQLPVESDDLSSFSSAFAFVGEKPVFFHLGRHAYILTSREVGAVRVISGLRLKEPRNCRFEHLSSEDGAVVSYEGIPLFKIHSDFTGRSSNFSGELSQIKAVLAINLLIFIFSLLVYRKRTSIRRWCKSGRRKIFAVGICALLSLLVLLFVFVGVLKVIVYTHISLSVFKISSLTVASAIVIVSMLMTLTSVLFLLASCGVPVFSRVGKLVSSCLCSAYLFSIIFLLGFNKERQLASAWAEGISIERDMQVEDLLRQSERKIASDDFIAFASISSNGTAEIRRHVADIFLRNLPLDYDIKVRIGADQSSLGVDEAVRISNDSRFLHAPLQSARCRYVGTFIYFIPSAGMRSVSIIVEPKPEIKNRVFPAAFDPGRVLSEIPSGYSYARYSGRERQFFSGKYAYPTVLSDEKYSALIGDDDGYQVIDSYMHFVCPVDDEDIVIISRPAASGFFLAIAFLLLQLSVFLPLSLIPGGDTRRRKAEKNYFRRRISLVLMFSLIVTLTVLAVVSVLFVYDRNESNMRTLMSDKVNAICSMLQSGVRTVRSTSELSSRWTLELMRRVSETTSSDIDIYAPDGRLLLSTVPGTGNRFFAGRRMNGEAYEQIIYEHKGYYIHKESYGPRSYSTMYAPLFGSGGDLIAVFSSPYTETSYDFGEDAVMHAVGIVALFIILLLVSRFLTSAIVDKIFRPLSEMGEKMSYADLDNLEPIVYERNDEITSLVESYNRMVSELSASSKALAQAERDKAWSGMARQVAHEIKNPLTPMKLQIQRIIRLKSQNDPSWQDKFDDMAGILLEHIEVLTQTANEFSTFAKLYTEEPVRFDLGKMVRDEIALFSSVPGVEMEYDGPEAIEVSGPKPQMTRVVFNILNNAVQACSAGGEGKVRVTLAVCGDSLSMAFEDNGPGVSDGNVEKLFTPNFTTKSGGTGLGLAITRSVLESCGASIRYRHSDSLGGACFEITYPLG